MFYSKNFKKFRYIKHCFFSRKGGFSNGIYQSLNCGRGSKDIKKNINKNLYFVSKKMKVSPTKLMLMNQTHSNKVVVIDEKNKKLKRFKSDAIVTKLRGIALGVVTADCVPIILYEPNNQIIGCIHAGWKGALSGIIENTIKKFGPVREVEKTFVIEVAFDSVNSSTRHKSGVALRFPRIHRWRSDKKPEDADTLEMIRGFAGIGEVREKNGTKMDQDGNLLLF